METLSQDIISNLVKNFIVVELFVISFVAKEYYLIFLKHYRRNFKQLKNYYDGVLLF
jgi:hypothetical protein